MRRTPSAAGLWVASKHEVLFADKVMKEEDWIRHRSAFYRHGLQPVKLLRVMLGYFWVLVIVVLLSVCVGIYSTVLVQGYNWPMVSLQAVQTVFSAITFALTLLLVFKVNNSYNRWWEARKDVGQLVSFAHNITRQAVAYFPPDQPELVTALGRWVAASMWVVKAMVRPSADLRQELAGVLLPQELAWLMQQPHKQLALGQALSSIVAAARVDNMVRSRFDQMLTLYTFEFGACGRIYNTSIPLCFTRHTSRFLTCYLVLLPLLLWPMSGWGTPALAVVIAFLLLGVENISAVIEEPFHVIAFDAFCPAIHRDIQNILKMHASQQDGTNVPAIGGLNGPATPVNCSQPPLHFGALSMPAGAESQQLPNPPSSVAATPAAKGGALWSRTQLQVPRGTAQHEPCVAGSSRWSLDARRVSHQQHHAGGDDGVAPFQPHVIPPGSASRSALAMTSANSRTCLVAAEQEQHT